MQTGHRAEERLDALGAAQFEAAGPQKHHVAFADLDMMVAFGGVEVFGIDGVAGFEPFGMADFWDVDKHTPADDTHAGDVDGAFVGALEIDLSVIEPVVHLAAPEMMAESVEMGGGESVRFNREVIGTSR